MNIKAWATALVQDPDGSPSSARVCGVGCIVVAAICALGGLYLKRSDTAAVVAAIGAVGTGCLFARRKSEGTADA